MLRLLPVLVFLVISFFVQAQHIDSILSVYSNNYQQERVYLHFDKAAYSPGETIWFKAYLKEGAIPFTNSKNIYVDWVNDKGDLLYHTVAPILAGSVANGQFSLPEKYSSSLIHVRAYTNWMLNFDTDFVYQKNIRVQQEKLIAAIPLPTTFSLHFYPEGGDMIVGLRNKIAFKATDQSGRPSSLLKGVVQKNGLTIDSLRVVHNGMGLFDLFPDEGVRYSAKWTDGKGVEHITDLPSAKPEGINLQVSFSADKRVFTIERSPNVSETQKKLYLVGMMQENVLLKAAVDLKVQTVYSGIIPVETLPSGVLTLTVFDEAWNPIAERVLHINNGEYTFPVQTTILKKSLSKRGLNEIEITVPDSINANLSVSITDGEIESDNSNTIISHFLLSSELRGTIYNPAFYFENRSDTLAQKLDLVMLTNGWRRMRWQDIIKNKLPVINYPKEIRYTTLAGKLDKVKPALLQNAGKLMILLSDKHRKTQTILADIDREGNFVSDQILFDTAKVYYQLPQKLDNAKIEFKKVGIAPFKYSTVYYANDFSYWDTVGSTKRLQYFQRIVELGKIGKDKTLENVTVVGRIKTKLELMDEQYTRGLFIGGDAKQFNVLDDIRAHTYLNAINYIQGKVAGVQVITSNSYPFYSIIWRGGEPLLFLDEVSVRLGELLDVHPLSISYIKVFKPIFMGGAGTNGDISQGQYGAIAVYTKRGGERATYDMPELPFQEVAGYSPIREFSSPDYATAISENTQPDIRTTLFWKPQISTRKDANTIMLRFL